jgi:hypothetical protein
MIKDAGAYGSCDFCGTRRAKTVELSYITEHISERAYTFFGKAVDQLPYESAEGGYQGENFTTYELLTEHFEIELPRDDNSELLWAIIAEVGEDQWCAYDWTQLEIHESLAYSWKRFSDMVKHERRFFSKEESVEKDLLTTVVQFNFSMSSASCLGSSGEFEPTNPALRFTGHAHAVRGSVTQRRGH